MSYQHNQITSTGSGSSEVIGKGLPYNVSNSQLPDERLIVHQQSSGSQARPEASPESPSSSIDLLSSQEPWDNIYKLLQQLSDLKEANSKLKKKVQFLEGMKLLTKLHQEIRDDPEFSQFFNDFFHAKYSNNNNNLSSADGDDDALETADRVSRSHEYNFKENPSQINKSKSQVFGKGSPGTGLPGSSSSTGTLARERSKSVGHEDISMKESSAECNVKVMSSKVKRFPRWARVKTALGWDRSHNVTSTESSNSPKPSLVDQIKSKKGKESDVYSTASGPEFINYDEDVESGCETDKTSKSTSQVIGGGQRIIKGIISTHKTNPVRPKKTPRGPPIEADLVSGTSQASTATLDTQSAGYGLKSIITKAADVASVSLRSGIKGSKSLGDIHSGSNSRSKYLDESLEELGNHPTALGSTRAEVRRQATGSNIEDSEISRSGDAMLNLGHRILCDKSFEGDNNRLLTETATIKYAKSRYRSAEVGVGGVPSGSSRKPSMSPPVKRRSNWNKMKKVFANASEGPRPINQFLSESYPPTTTTTTTANIHSVPSSPISSETSFNYAQGIPWHETGSGDDGDLGPESDYMLPLSESATEPALNIVQELQRNLSEDFKKKIEAWERMKSKEGIGSFAVDDSLVSSKPAKIERKTSLPKLKKRKSDRKLEKYRAKYKDLNWVEKELSRVEKEKEKLDRERSKFEERIKVLQKYKQDALTSSTSTSSMATSGAADKSPNSKQILVRTSEGEFKFDGITDDFTRKLFEWETKKGLCPESSIISLLKSLEHSESPTPQSIDTPKVEQLTENDKQLMIIPRVPSLLASNYFNQHNHPLNKCKSRSESSIVDFGINHGLRKTSSNSLPSLKQITDQHIQIQLTQQQTMEMSPRRLHLMEQQKQVARQLFDDETINNQNQLMPQPMWCENEKCMVTVNPDGSTIIVGSKQDIYQMTKEILGEAGDEGYSSLLEANMFLLEKLKAKEDICRKLEMQLKQLDAKMDEMNNKHRKEMEKYREKLWEVHVAGNKSINIEDSYKTIGELKDRVEKLQVCSERLKADKEALEDSFQYHSEQQAKLAFELFGKMRNHQEISVQTDSNMDDNDNDQEGQEKKIKNVMKCDPENVVKLHDLTTHLLEKARELEAALIERTKQICRLRWELLNREVSAMKLKTELQSVQWKDGKMTSDDVITKRSKYGQRRSWSSSEKLNLQSANRGRINQLSGLDVESWITSDDWPKIQKESTELSQTVQQLKVELLKLTSQASGRPEISESLNDGERLKKEGEKGLNELFASPIMKDLLPEYEAKRMPNYSDQGKVSSHHRSSGDNASSFSGPEGSESSSLNEGDRASYVLPLPRNRWRRSRDNVSSSSESSFKEDESFTVIEWCRPRTSSYLNRRKPSDLETTESDLAGDMVLQYTGDRRSNISRSSSEMTDQQNGSWGELYKHRLFFNQFSETSSSAYNEGLEESSSASGNPFPSYDTPDSTQSNLRSSSSSGHDRYTGIPMIDEDFPISSGSTSRKESEFQIIPEGQAISLSSTAEERRHSEPCRKFKYSIRTGTKSLASNSALTMAEVKEDQTPSPVVYTVRLSPARIQGASSKQQPDQTQDEPSSPATATTTTTESSEGYIFTEPKENIFFRGMIDAESPMPLHCTSHKEHQTQYASSNSLESDSGRCVIIESTTNCMSTDQYQTDSKLNSVTKIEWLEPTSKAIQTNRSPSATSLTSVGSERSSVRARISEDSQTSLKEKENRDISRSTSRSSLSSRVASFITRRSRSKSRPRADTPTSSAVSALCRQSLTFCVDTSEKSTASTAAESAGLINLSSTNESTSKPKTSQTFPSDKVDNLSKAICSRDEKKTSSLLSLFKSK